MAAEERPAVRGTIPIVIATAAVTLAIGVTVAAVSGYLAPAGNGGRTPPEQTGEPSAVEAQRTAPPSGPSIVLVPVAPDVREERAVPAGSSEVLLAAYQPADHDDDDPQGGDRRERDDDDD